MEDTKNSSLRERLKNIHKELKDVKKTLNSHPDSIRRQTVQPAQYSAPGFASGKTSIDKEPLASLQATQGFRQKNGIKDSPAAIGNRPLSNERFADYLAANIEIGTPLRHQRRRQRNRILATIIVVVVALVWLAGYLLYRFQAL